jgi:hypothetical protein
VRRGDQQLVDIRVLLFIGIDIAEFEPILVLIVFELFVIIRGQGHLFFFVVFVIVAIEIAAAVAVQIGVVLILIVAIGDGPQLGCFFKLLESIQLHRSFSLMLSTLHNGSYG